MEHCELLILCLFDNVFLIFFSLANSVSFVTLINYPERAVEVADCLSIVRIQEQNTVFFSLESGAKQPYTSRKFHVLTCK